MFFKKCYYVINVQIIEKKVFQNTQISSEKLYSDISARLVAIRP